MSRKLLNIAGMPVRAALDVLQTGDEYLRALVGDMAGVPGTGPETPFGRAPTGEELFTGLTGTALPANVPGKAQWRDVPGFLTEIGVSPWWFLGAGALTKTGKGAAEMASLGRRAKALEVLASTKSLLPSQMEELTGLRAAIGALEQRGVTPLAGRLAEQGARGERSLFSLHVPFTSIDAPLPIVGGRMASRAGLGTAGLMGRGLAGLTRPIAPLFRVGGRVARDLEVARGAQRMTGEEFNALIQAGPEQFARHWSGRAHDEAEMLTRRLATLDRAEAEAARSRIIGELRPQAAAMLERDRSLKSLQKRIETATEGGDLDEARRLTQLLKRRWLWLQSKLDITAGLERPTDPRAALLSLGVQRGPTEERLAAKEEEMVAEYTEKISKARGKHWRAIELGQGLRADTYDRMATKLSHELENKVAELAVKKRLNARAIELLPDGIRREVGRWEGLLGETLRRGQEMGVPVSELHGELGYLTHGITGDALRVGRELDALGLKSPFVRYARIYTTRTPFTKERVKAFRDLTELQINDWFDRYIEHLRASGVAVNWPKGAKFFAEDPSQVLLRRLTAEGQAEGAAALSRGVVEGLSLPGALAVADDVPVHEFLYKSGLASIGGVQLPHISARFSRSEAEKIRAALKETKYAGRYIPREFAKAVLDTHRMFAQPEELRNFSKATDTYLAMMRYWVTSAGIRIPGLRALGSVPAALGGGTLGGAVGGPVGAAVGAGLGLVAGHTGSIPLFPVFHIRNAVSNVFNAWLGGMRDVGQFGRAWRMQVKYDRALASPETFEAILKSDPELRLYQFAREHGAVGHTISGELADIMAEAESGSQARLPNLTDRLLHPGRTSTGQAAVKFGAMIENNAKLGMFLDGLKSGLSPAAAGERVKKFLFDYGALSPFEKKYLRRWAFFYTWTRNNLPLQVEQLLTNPRKMRLWAMGTGEMGESPQKRYLAEHERGRSAVYLGRDERAQERFINLDLPPSDLNLLSTEGLPPAVGARRIGQKLAMMLAPHIREPMEAVFGTSLSSGKPAPITRLLGAVLPSTRIQSNLRTLRAIESGEKPASELGRLFVGPTVYADPRKARYRRELLRILGELEEEAALGRARQYRSYSPTDKQEPGRVKLLEHERRILEEKLSRLSRGAP